MPAESVVQPASPIGSFQEAMFPKSLLPFLTVEWKRLTVNNVYRLSVYYELK
ncbi:hypothetical protein RRU94_22110 [Domibacillus sp. DTU_2020_1001157_1_SI_ALB_TIR_016]|uniref:hypothetical protein n=1 Tax=Domibacillus sp. DTU_2020_1001157_1_SI_ALB_TIR_016 TaxID=3077789 RepID=UPI0028E47BB4|nr:hypothetical protein [Domibacillus sp. DTU_2020_1001157_1_SI_ALB_TIR_016]WNS80182.1 hypothetical protein RRU94_22110 [Domibacillus sp. DTU_2020_1001157_1_SI_ALB_TIR_016]